MVNLSEKKGVTMGSFATLFHPGSKSVDKSEYDQTTSEFATANDDQGLVYGVEDQYDQIISELKSVTKWFIRQNIKILI